MINIDTFTEIGKIHKICEDYIISGFDPVPYIILSDGCSSSKHTDTGARILTHLAKNYLRDTVNVQGLESLAEINYKEMGISIIYQASLLAQHLGLNLSNLDATLIVSFSINNSVKIYIYGDGFIIWIDKDRNVRYVEISFSSNAPFYLTYLIDKEKNSIYKEANLHKTERFSDLSNFLNNFEIETPYDKEAYYGFNTNKFPTILIASDGISSFIHKDNDMTVITDSIVTEFTRFKIMKGEFVTRKSKKAIQDIKTNDIFHLDDIAIGGYHLEEE